MSSSPQLGGVRLVALSAGVAAAYVASAVLGFRVAFVAEQVTTVWAPTGIAIAALLLWGLRTAPAVWVGAFLANAGTAAPLWTAVIIASGNTAEALAAFYLLRSFTRFDPGLSRVRDVASFINIAVMASPIVSATIGVTTLAAAGAQGWDRYGQLWFAWWLGDALGALVVAPVILTMVRRESWDRVRAAAFVVGSALVAFLVFGQVSGASGHPFEYAVFPVVIVAALRGGPAVTALVVFTTSIVAIWHTAQGLGPFQSASTHQSLILLQTFMGVLAGTGLLLAAAIAERRASEEGAQQALDELRHREEMLRQARQAGVSAEGALRESRDVLSLAMHGGSMGAWSRNLLTNEVWWSPELEEIFGLEPGGFSKTEAGFFEFVHPDDRSLVRHAVDDAVASVSDYSVEFRFLHASGEWRWMEGRGRAMYEPDGRPRNLYGIGIDVTSRKRAAMALEDAKNAAESANQLKDQFLATLSHELRTPLNAILGYARLLQTDAIPPEKRQRAIEVIERNAVTQHRLVEDLLDMSRITTGRIRLDPVPVPIVAVLREAVDGIVPTADAKGLALELDLDPFAGSVKADATRLQQVFWNLLTNAVKFTNQGGRVTVSLRRDGAHVETVVSDTGIGIAADFLPFIFEPFRQADARFGRRHGGLGLGLAISKQLVELHGGSISASSKGEGTGATFAVRLPRIGAEAVAEQA